MTISFNGSSSSCNNAGLKFKIDAAGNLICTYPDNTIENLGRVVGFNGQNGTDFYPDDVGEEVPDMTFRPEKPYGWSYLSLANGKSILYFKTSEIDVVPVTWNSTEIGKGEKGDSGRPFTIDSSGTIKPTTNLYDEYTFFDTTTGSIWMYDEPTTDWRGPYQWTGPKGEQGVFKIDLDAHELPDITNLPYNYTVYDTDDGMLFYVMDDPNNPGQKTWSKGIPFRGKQGNQGIQGIQGESGENGDSVYIVHNVIDTSYTNAVLVVGTCPKGYVVTDIQLDVVRGFSYVEDGMFVRFGGTAQSKIDGTVIAPKDYFDIAEARKYIVNEVNHQPSDKDEILSCVFDASVNNSPTGLMNVTIQMAYQLPDVPISNNI